MARIDKKTTERPGINSFVLRILAAAATIAYCIKLHLGIGPEAFLYLNWFAYPIFAFMLAEGFDKSSDRYIYLRRILIFALLSEIPYNYAVSGSYLDTDSQNVLFTLLAGGIGIYVVESIRIATDNIFVTLLAEIGMCWVGYTVGSLLNFEMASYGIVIVMVFYIAQKITYPRLFMLLFLGILSFYLKTDTHIFIQIGRFNVAFNEITMSIPAMAAILLYNGKRGPNSNTVKLAFYLFYPVLLGIIAFISSKSA